MKSQPTNKYIYSALHLNTSTSNKKNNSTHVLLAVKFLWLEVENIYFILCTSTIVFEKLWNHSGQKLKLYNLVVTSKYR